MEPISIQQSGAKAWNKKEHVDRVLLQNSKNKKIPGRKQNVWNIYLKKLNVVFRFFLSSRNSPVGEGGGQRRDTILTEAQQKWTRKIWKSVVFYRYCPQTGGTEYFLFSYTNNQNKNSELRH